MAIAFSKLRVANGTLIVESETKAARPQTNIIPLGDIRSICYSIQEFAIRLDVLHQGFVHVGVLESADDIVAEEDIDERLRKRFDEISKIVSNYIMREFL